jgi:ABC-type lipoprotein export system ATPase subunit
MQELAESLKLLEKTDYVNNRDVSMFLDTIVNILATSMLLHPLLLVPASLFIALRHDTSELEQTPDSHTLDLNREDIFSPIFGQLGSFFDCGVQRQLARIAEEHFEKSCVAEAERLSNTRLSSQSVTLLSVRLLLILAGFVCSDESVAIYLRSNYAEMLDRFVKQSQDFWDISRISLKNYDTMSKLSPPHELSSSVAHHAGDFAEPSSTRRDERLSIAFSGTHLGKLLDFQLPESGIVHITGPSGKGKSTLIAKLLGRSEDLNGVLVNNTPLDVRMSRVLQRRSLVVPPSDALLSFLTIRENVSGLTFSEAPDLLDFDAVDLLGLRDKIDTQVDQLSTGQRQRAAFLPVLARHRLGTRIFAFDEATANVDEENEKSCEAIIRCLASDSLVLLVSHDRGLLARLPATLEISLG